MGAVFVNNRWQILISADVGRVLYNKIFYSVQYKLALCLNNGSAFIGYVKHYSSYRNSIQEQYGSLWLF